MSIDIVNRWTRAVLYHSDTADSIRAAVLEGASAGADLSRADLSRALNLDREVLVIIGSQHTIRATLQDVRIGCECHSIDHWLEHYATIGRDADYPLEAIDEYGHHLRRIKGVMEALALMQPIPPAG